jgi:hypothetical protein
MSFETLWTPLLFVNYVVTLHYANYRYEPVLNLNFAATVCGNYLVTLVCRYSVEWTLHVRI